MKPILKVLNYTILFLILSSLSLFSLNIVGKFSGWNGSTVVKLSDGSFWIQSKYYNYSCSYTNPKVEVFKDGYGYKMVVHGCCNKEVAVEPLYDVIESRIDGVFKGWSGNTIFDLANGSTWQQTEYDYFYDYEVSPSCYLYYDSGWHLTVLGHTIGVKKYVEPVTSKTTTDRSITNDNTSVNYDDIANQMMSDANKVYQNNSNSEIINKQTNLNTDANKTSIQVANKSSKNLYFCIAYYTQNNGWQSVGWYNVQSGSSSTVDIGYYSGNVYLYAEYNAGELSWFDPNAKYSFCIHKSDAFLIPHADTQQVSNSNYKRVKMSEFNVNPGIFIWTLTD